jgi:hypothetical protein
MLITLPNKLVPGSCIRFLKIIEKPSGNPVIKEDRQINL